MKKTTPSRLLQEGQALDRRGGSDIQLMDALILARALGVSSLALLEPGEHRVRLSDRDIKGISGKRFRDWTLGKMPLKGMDGQLFADTLPQSVAQVDEAPEV